MSVSVTGLIRYGWIVEPFVDGTAGPPIVQGSADGETVAYTWDGRAADGTPAPDGTYRITVWTADASDNRSSVQQLVDDRQHGAGPDRDGQRRPRSRPTATAGSTSRTLEPDQQRAGQRARARVMDADGIAVRTWKFAATTTGSWTWDGKDAAGKTVRDGTYTFRLDGVDPAGNGTVQQLPVVVDRTIGSITWATPSFKPQGGADRPAVRSSLTRPATVAVSIYQGKTLVRRVWVDKAVAAGTFSWSWNGRNGHRELVQPGVYTASITATSAIGVSHLTRTVTRQGAVRPQARLAAAPLHWPDDRCTSQPQRAGRAGAGDLPPGAGVWVILPTYNEADNVGPITAAILDALPAATVLVVDDDSPDGTGRLADELAAADPRIRVLHRAAKQGLGRAYLDGFARRPRTAAPTTVVQMDADFSHDPASLPALVAAGRRGLGGPRHRLALHARRRRGRLGRRSTGHLPRREPVRPHRAGPRAPAT